MKNNAGSKKDNFLPTKKQITVFSGCCIKDDSVLMVRRFEPECPDAHLKWEFPGGKVEFDEVPQQALFREFLEETGARIQVHSLLPFVQTSYWKYKWGTQQTFCFCFLCEYTGQEKLLKKDHHVSEIAWVRKEAVNNLASLPGTRELFAIAQEVFRKNGEYNHQIAS